MTIKQRLDYYRKIERRFGSKAVKFLLQSKFRKKRTENIKMSGVKFPLILSDFHYDVMTLFQIFYAKEYEIDFDNPPEYIIDCGANIGLSAVYFANRFPKAKIIAIEPDRNNFRVLSKNVSYYHNIIPLNKAIWYRPTSIATIDTGHGGWAIQTKESNSDNSIEGVTIKELLIKYNFPRIDFLKIDIEGAEQELFSDNYESWLKLTLCIAIELHEFLREGSSLNFYEAIRLYNFHFHKIGENSIYKRSLTPKTYMESV